MLLTLFVTILLDLIGFGILMPILPHVVEEFGASSTTFGLLMSGYAATQFLCAPLWGRLSDRYGRRPIMLLTITGGGVALLWLATASSLWTLFAARLVSGAFAGNIGLATAYITDVTDEANRARGMGLIGMAFGLGFIIGPALGSVLSQGGFRTPLFWAAGMTLANALQAWWTLREPTRHVATAERQLSLHTNGCMRHFLSWNFLLTVGITQLEAILVYFLADRYGYDQRHAGYILAFTAVIMALMQGGVVRRIPAARERASFLIGTVLLGGGVFVLPLSVSTTALFVALAVSSVGRGLCQPMLLSMVSKQADPQTRGAVMGSFQSAASLARVFAPALAGWLYALHLGSPFYIGGLLILLVAAWATLAQRTPSP